MHFRNLSNLYFSTLNYRVLYFYLFFLLKVFAFKPCHLFRKILLLWYLYIVSFLLCLRFAEDEGEFNNDEKSENGLSRRGENRPEWITWGYGTMQSSIDLLNKRVEVVSHLGRLKSNYKPTYAKRERKICSTPSYLIIWVTPLTIKHSLIRTKSSYIHGSFNHFIVKYRPTQSFQMPTMKFSKPEFGPNDKTRDWPDTTRNRRDSNWKIRPDSTGQFRVIFSPTQDIQVESGMGTNPTRPDPRIALLINSIFKIKIIYRKWKHGFFFFKLKTKTSLHALLLIFKLLYPLII